MDAIPKPSPDPDEFRRWYERELDLWTRVTLSGLVINGKMKERADLFAGRISFEDYKRSMEQIEQMKGDAA